MKKQFKVTPKLLGCLIFIGSSPSIFAAEATSTLTVTANVQSACVINNATLAFGEYLPVTTHANADLDGATTVGVTCTNGTTAQLFSATPTAQRTMTNSTGSVLNYQLYTTASRDTILGTTDASDTIPVVGTGVTQPIDLYGIIPQNQQVTTGNYTGTANLTISY